MKFWLLRPVENLPDNDDPWNPWYDKVFGFVVRANDEQQAREIAQENAGDEQRGIFLGLRIANTTTPWLDPKYSTCVELSKLQGDEPDVILSDYHSA